MNDKGAEYYASEFTDAQIHTRAGEAKDSFIGWTRFCLGDFQCTVVTDGPLRMGPPEGTLPKADPKEIAELLTAAFLPTDSMTLNQNLLIVNTSERATLSKCENRNQCHGLRLLDGSNAHPRSSYSAEEGLLQRGTLQPLTLP
jgi:hypothetical protein